MNELGLVRVTAFSTCGSLDGVEEHLLANGSHLVDEFFKLSMARRNSSACWSERATVTVLALTLRVKRQLPCGLWLKLP
jgi:hypothetical protein